jgi:membrane fusion protein (multidrug efflux system)
MKFTPILVICLALISLSLPACKMHKEEGEGHHEANQLVATSPKVKDVVITQEYVCLIHSQRHINIKALESGYLEPIPVKEGQAVTKDLVMFRVIPVLFKAKLEGAIADAELAEIKYKNTVKLHNQGVVSEQEVKLAKAEWDKTVAKRNLAEAEMKFTEVKAPFDGIIDRLHEQQGSLIKEGDCLTTLSDNSVMWVYFNVPEKRYLEYMAAQRTRRENWQELELVDSEVQLKLADGSRFAYDAGNVVTVEGKVNHETGNIQFRADFPNRDRLLRNGQTGNIVIYRTVHNATVIPQRSTFEERDKYYVWVIDHEEKVHRREITILHEMDDVFLVKSGLNPDEKIVFEGVRQVKENDKVEFEYREPDKVMANQKNWAE